MPSARPGPQSGLGRGTGETGGSPPHGRTSVTRGFLGNDPPRSAAADGGVAKMRRMPIWADVMRAEPELSEEVTRLLTGHRHHVMATLRKDGSPRLSGTEVEIVEGDLVLAMMAGALRAHDLRRDPRVALHTHTVDPPKARSERLGRGGDDLRRRDRDQRPVGGRRPVPLSRGGRAGRPAPRGGDWRPPGDRNLAPHHRPHPKRAALTSS